MSIYIKGDIRIPKLGFVTLLLWQNGDVTDRQARDIGKAVEVPPHGALKDADALALAMMDAQNADQALAMVDDADTIIPAGPEDTADPEDLRKERTT